MKSMVVTALVLSLPFFGSAQTKPQVDWPEYQFTTLKANPVTSVKNQYRSGTCWCFSSLGFFESEVIRLNGIEDEAAYPDFSEMFVVSHSYKDRAEKYIRLDGNLRFSAGSSADDVLDVINDYGIVPQNAMPGMNYGTELPEQAEMDAVLAAYVKAISANPNKTLSTAWKRGFDAVVDEYLGEYPEKFTVDGKEYTPQSYRDALGIKPEDYISLTSFTHHPFYTKFAVEVCDNWRWNESYNLPLDEFMTVVDNAIENGFTIAWGTDVSQAGFTRDGMAVLVDLSKLPKKTAGSDQEHWVGKDEKKAAKTAKTNIQPPVEYEVTQELRQQWFDNKTITDDHGMLIYGTAKDQFGTRYYLVKNSWGVTGKYEGIWYATEAFVKGQTMDILVHKDAVPKAILEKLGIR